ncbi:tyrosine-protein phosphatase [Nocardia terrae]|uniref:tyrosine-protein phosphatase n=1 Tax=Nocardia terrae TaxID=2675851 RepID=UPI0012F7BD32|nr:tyrosine-protein phosphatase [Nocardia terrae]
MTISRALRGTLTGVAAALIAAVPITLTPAVQAAPTSSILRQAPVGADFALQGAPNARDIGGVAANNGVAQIKSGQVFRTDALNHLTGTDQQTLIAAGVTKVIDFRSPTERAQNPDSLPASIPEESLPVYDPNNDFYLFFAKAVQGGPTVQQQLLGDGKAAQFMVDYYKWMVTDPTARAQFGTALKDIANASGPVLYHCTAGKDRTGWMTAILMSILGTPNAAIYDNYLLSNDRLAASNKATMDALVAKGLVTDPSLFAPVLGVQSDYLDAAFAQAVQSYGTMNNFVFQGLGIDGATVGILQAKLIQQGGIGN